MEQKTMESDYAIEQVVQKLTAPFPPELISWRPQGRAYEKNGRYSAAVLAYVDARDVMQRLDNAVGVTNWQDSYRDDNGTTMCALSIRFNGEWITKEDGSGDTAVEAEKGAVSKALVRAAVKWGIGRYLYALGTTYAQVETYMRGNDVVIKKILPQEKNRLQNILLNLNGAPTLQLQPCTQEMQNNMYHELHALDTVEQARAWWAANADKIQQLPREIQDDLKKLAKDKDNG